MDEQFTIRLLVAAGSAVIGVLFLAYAGWARAGRTPRARAWMGNEFGGFDTDERMAVLGAPCIGVLCLSFSASILPVVGLYLLIVAAPVALLAFLGMIWAAMLDIPLPAFLYPAWARPLRERNLRTERATKQWLRSHWQ